MKKNYRVKKEKDFSAVFKNGENTANRKFVIYKLEKEQPHYRLGLSVSKKLGNAVKRNQIKRWIRHIVMAESDKLDPKVDFVVIARKGVENLTFAEFEKNLLHALKVAKMYQEGIMSEKEVKN
ncbi:ribonuclease P protein component [Streptococcus massiliensis]|uniref:Ribonuclease P protein component n=1 Tax=Streptococcus massiliensis TaxID=313439 RepID=A0A380KZD5_9STRE|nr:ribonuclease P protein component [Streptococcus massiliensis]SUN77108.1 ribonuclease P [Streptococcus massiliensis]